DDTVQGLIAQTKNERMAYDSYRRLINMFGDVVMGVDHEYFEEILDSVKKKKGVKLDTELDVKGLKEVVEGYKNLVREKAGKPFPNEPLEQLRMAIDAVFKSWNIPRAITYRKLNKIPHDLGTAVNVQTMVFGNMGDDCATGVAFTRDPSTGENKFYGEYLFNAQGEDVVAGIRTPQPINEAENSLEKLMPELYKQLYAIRGKLENHYADIQDLEFTIQNHKLWILQTRNGKRTPAAAVKIAVDMVEEGLIDKKQALMRINPSQLDQLLHPTLDPKAKKNVIGKGLPASPGAAVGKVVFNAEEAEDWVHKGEKVILVRTETSPEDINGMHVAEGILTARGGMTSHAAVVARGMGKCCVAGCNALNVDEAKGKATLGDVTVSKGDFLTLDGSSGEIILGQVGTVEPKLSGNFGTIMQWADEVRMLNVRTNADTPHDCQVARDFGAEGIGLTRTEHMFFDADRIKAVREMILSKNVEQRKKALAKLLPMQKSDFKGIFKVMQGLPVTIRLLDPPLHEFLPKADKEIEELSREMSVPKAELEQKIENLMELNPMLGHRGCRLAITWPEIYEMQVQAIIEAACELKKEENLDIVPEIMIPLVGHVNELAYLRKLTEETANAVIAQKGVDLKYVVGTMIELPRAALTADEIATQAQFFSFGTNDLTQTTFGLSRDDAGKFLPEYIDKGILACDPFVSIDQNGVGSLIQIAKEKGRKVNPDIKLGICGEHGGDPASIEFCHNVGLNYVSCSPYRVPVARLAAAQAVLKNS
ncbi:MAG: pyruvate, phosphate dikinase, partial [Gammaproteobacteria bacterium]|nr:pyruvate, phosphate dikinase [Gammaproteobacteria bacterium]